MSSSLYRGQLDRKRQQRLAAEKQAGVLRSKESTERARAAKARSAASSVTNPSTAASKLREADRAEAAAAAAGRDAARKQDEASRYAKEEANLLKKVADAERSEIEAERRKQEQAQRRLDHRTAADRRAWEHRLLTAEAAMRALRAPKPERLRVLLLGSSSVGDLRVGREQKRIRAAVDSALHRDLIEFDVRPAATTSDLLDGITRFRPHVVHFSGHSDEAFIEFEDEKDEPHEGVIVTATAFGSAVRASDEPPVLIFLNCCKSASQIDALVGELIPLAIGMADDIEDVDAITYAAQFYAAVANGQSVQSAHLTGRAALELAGLAGADLPTLAVATGVDPADVVLVEPPN